METSSTPKKSSKIGNKRRNTVTIIYAGSVLSNRVWCKRGERLFTKTKDCFLAVVVPSEIKISQRPLLIHLVLRPLLGDCATNDQ